MYNARTYEHKHYKSCFIVYTLVVPQDDDFIGREITILMVLD